MILIYTLSRVLHGVLHNEIASLDTSTKELDRGINARFTSKSKFKEFNEAIEVLRELLKDFIAGKDPLLFSRKADLLQSLFFFPLFSSYLAKYSKYLNSDVKSVRLLTLFSHGKQVGSGLKNSVKLIYIYLPFCPL